MAPDDFVADDSAPATIVGDNTAPKGVGSPDAIDAQRRCETGRRLDRAGSSVLGGGADGTSGRHTVTWIETPANVAASAWP